MREVWQLGWSKKGKRCANCDEMQYISRETQGIMTLGYLSILFVPIMPFIIKLSSQSYDAY